MRTRKHRRLWLALALAACLASQDSPRAAYSNDLSTRVTVCPLSGTAWSYLVEDCIDSKPYTFSESCPAESSASGWSGNSRYAPLQSASQWSEESSLEGSAALKSSFASLMDADWSSTASQVASLWERASEQAQRISSELRKSMLPTLGLAHGYSSLQRAAFPEEGVPPSPIVRGYEIPKDTCEFATSFQEQLRDEQLLQRKADQLLNDFDRIARITVERVWTSKRAAFNLEQTSGIGYSDLVAKRTGGIFIVEIPIVPARYAPGMTDEYAAYDLDPRDNHWLSGIGKSWGVLPSQADSFEEGIASEQLATSEVVAPQLSIVRTPMISDDTLAALASFANDVAIGAVDRVRDVWTPDATEAQTSMPSKGSLVLGNALDQLDHWNCIVQSELCDLGSFYRTGQQLGQLGAVASHQSMKPLLAIGKWIDVRRTSNESLQPSYIIYTADDGEQFSVPMDLAKMWEESKVYSDPMPSKAPISLSIQQTEQNSAAPISTMDVQWLGRRALALAASKIESLGGKLQEWAGQLHRFAEPQIASRDEGSVR